MYKKGEVVLVSQDGTNWYERGFITEHRGRYLCEYLNNPREVSTWEFIKPNVKVGDWIYKKSSGRIFKYKEGMKLGDWYKITDKTLIDKLEELCNLMV